MRPDPDQARAWLESELARPEYHQQGLLERLQTWLDELWLRLAAAASGAGRLSTVVAVVLALLLIVAALLVLPRIRRTPAPGGDSMAVLGGERVGADERRRRAEEALAEGRWEDAVVEAMRALALRMVDRGVLEDTPGSTAHEIALTVADAFPSERARLVGAAELFDAVQYGGGRASREQAQDVLDLNDELRRTRPLASTGNDTPWPAVPR
ncbi:MAG TPA: DUF4129 domain-containing protein [Nocardioidaceae bacterium]